jgi:RHS repeat-associated protein
LTFDYNHRVIGIGTTNQFAYDGRGNRLLATRTGVTTCYIYDPWGNLMAEADSNGITRKYIYGKGLLAVATSDGHYCYHFNGTGSTVAITDMSESVVNSYAYDAFGQVLAQEETIVQPFKFVGRYGVMAEPNGLYYMRARYYDPGVGRFISEDPLGFGGGDVNLFAYVQNDPVNHIDPMGLDAYMCTKPLDALGGAGQWAYQNGVPLLYHQYICIKDGQTTVCGGQDRSGGPYSPGKPSSDHFDEDRCEKKDDRSCMDKCLTKAIQDPNRPYYGVIGPGTNCHEWANDSYTNCVQQCKGQ